MHTDRTDRQAAASHATAARFRADHADDTADAAFRTYFATGSPGHKAYATRTARLADTYGADADRAAGRVWSTR